MSLRGRGCRLLLLKTPVFVNLSGERQALEGKGNEESKSGETDHDLPDRLQRVGEGGSDLSAKGFGAEGRRARVSVCSSEKRLMK